MKEEWRDIKGFEGLYQVSNMGNVKSLERTVWDSRGYYKTVSEKILKPYDNGLGYLRVKLHKDGNREQPLVHVLVAAAFCENLEGYTEVNHINEIKSDNRAENLEYCSRSYNINYGTRTEKTCKPVFSVDKETGLIMYWESAMEAERCTGIDQSSITKCCKGKANSAGNHYWFYADDDDNE